MCRVIPDGTSQLLLGKESRELQLSEGIAAALPNGKRSPGQETPPQQFLTLPSCCSVCPMGCCFVLGCWWEKVLSGRMGVGRAGQAQQGRALGRLGLGAGRIWSPHGAKFPTSEKSFALCSPCSSLVSLQEEPCVPAAG